MKEEQPFGHPVERRLFSLLQQKQTRFSLNQIQAFMLRNALETNLILFTKFIATCASTISTPAGIRHARRVFEHRPPSHRHDTFLCNTMIEAHKDSRQFAESFCLYRDLRRYTSFLPDNFTFLSLSKSCSSNLLLWEGQQLHDHVIRNGYSLDLFVSTALVDMYAKFGDIMGAAKLFDQMTQRSQVSWTCLVCGYARSGDIANARKYFYEMPQKDLAAFNAMIDAYVKVGDMDSAQSLFDVMPERNVISWTTLISGYCINNFVDSARQLFDAMPEKNLISWNAMIGGYCQNKQPHEALKLFHELQSSTLFEPDEVTIASILPAISDLGAFDLGRWVHHYVQTKRLDKATNVCTSLIDMYAKCGEITKAMQVFESMPRTENPPWNAMINGFAVNGRGKEALEVFQEMLNCGIQPNEITMIAVLSACNHSGLVEEGKRWLKEMGSFGLTPAIEHYGCVIDLLGRAGHLEEAEKLLNSMPYEANRIIMSSFLCACGFSKDLMKAERAIQKAIKMDPSSDGNYVLLRNLYAMERRWTDVEEIKGLMRRSGAKKEAGCSVIEENSKVLEFVSGDKMHPKWDVIGSVLKQLQIHMKGRRGDPFNL